MTSRELIEDFNKGSQLFYRDGRKVIAVAEHEVGPSLICGEDEDTIAVRFEGDKSDDWDVIDAKDVNVLHG